MQDLASSLKIAVEALKEISTTGGNQHWQHRLMAEEALKKIESQQILLQDKPHAFVESGKMSMDLLQEMLKVSPELYDNCLSTLGFAYGFSQLANKAIHFDYCLLKGIIPKDYLSAGGKSEI